MKSEVYSWRLTPDMKLRLETEARRAGKSLAEVLEEISADWLSGRGEGYEEEREASRLRERIMATVGTVRGGDSRRVSRSKELLRGIIKRKHEKERNASRRTD